MLRLALLSAFVAVVLCDCNSMAREKVKQQWSEIYHHSRHDIGQAIWRAAFSEDPHMRDYFKRVHGDDTEHPAFVAHSQRVLGGLDMVISVMDHDDIFRSTLEHLKEQHDERDLTPEVFATFKHALMHAASAVLARCFDEDAWSSCIDVVADGIMGH